MKLADLEIALKGKVYKPLICGGMGVDISTAALALEVSRLGGIGHISDAMSPFVNDKYLKTRYQNTKQKANANLEITSAGVPEAKWAKEEVYAANKSYVQSVMEKKKGSGGVFVNVMEKLTLGNPVETLQARLAGAMDGGADGITLSAGLHMGTFKLVEDHPRFHDVNFGIIVSSARALKIFLRSAERVKRMPDYIVVEGPLAGGHLGFGEDWKQHKLETIVQEVAQLLEESELDIPIVAAGGVFDAKDAFNIMRYGACAVQVATRFTISQECGLPAKVKHIYINSKEEDVVVNTSSPTGYPMRMLSCSPSLSSNTKPNCHALGYLLDKDGKCSYHFAYEQTGFDEKGNKLPVKDKMCICYHFMKYDCYTCGHNVFRLKEKTNITEAGIHYLPKAEEIYNDYVQTKVDLDSIEKIKLNNEAADQPRLVTAY